MAFVLTHPVSTPRNTVSTRRDTATITESGHRAARWLRHHTVMTPQQRADRYVSRMPLAVLA